MSKNHKIWETQMSGVFGRDMAELAPSSKSPAEFAAMPERARLAEMKAAAAVPPACGPEIPLAPARGAFRVFSPMTVRVGSAGQPVVERGGYQGPGEATPRMAVELLDPVSEANIVAKARHDGRDDGGPFRAPFTPGQVAIARHYAALVEKQAAGGIKCIDLQGRSGGGAGNGSIVDAQMRISEELGHLRLRIGGGVALEVRRIRPSKRGGPGAIAITDRALVDMFCLEGKSFVKVLRKHRWAVNGRRVADLREALSKALFRMQGYVRPSTAKD